MPRTFAELLDAALQRRASLLETLHAEGTDAYRLFHGIAEGRPGLTVDRYGPRVLLQTFRDPLPPGELAAVEGALRARLPFAFGFAYNHRGKAAAESFDAWHRPAPEALVEAECREGGLRFLFRPRHQGIDPWLFLDLRSARRRIRETSRGLTVLNLFAYTCGAGVCAAAGGAREVWNVDFAASNLETGRRNAERNGAGEDRFRTIQEDCLPVLRQLAGLPPGGRRGKTPPFRRLEPRRFDLVVLDPPAWSKGAFGAVDTGCDYPSLFKPALLATAPGGRVLATNHVPSVKLGDWLGVLERCAAKAGRPLHGIETIAPEADFPSFDGQPPLKVAVCRL